MVEIKKTIHQTVQQLYFNEKAEIEMSSFAPIKIQLFNNRSQIDFSTPVYFGHNYIPGSVRSSLQKRPFANELLGATLNLDEDKFEITLDYQTELERLNEDTLNGLLEEFNWLAEEWRLYLDENDRNDLIHVRAGR